MHIFLSPHFDDAIGSAGGLISRLVANGERVAVATIFAGLPWLRPWKIPKVLIRRRENRRACRASAAGAAAARVINLNFLDGVWRAAHHKKSMLFDGVIREPELVRRVVAAIKKIAKPGDVIYAPAGLGNHIDHLIVRDAAALLENETHLYEEFYYGWKTGVSMPGFKRFNLTDDECEARTRAALCYEIEMKKLFRGARAAAEYFAARRFERYDWAPPWAAVAAPRTIVSLTSFPARIPTISQVVETIKNQSVQPDKIVLYLSKKQFPRAPKVDGVEVRMLDGDIRSYKKLVPALADFPNDNIITLDDDILYPDFVIEKLLDCHRRFPGAICGLRVKRAAAGPYRLWHRMGRKNMLRFGGRRPRLCNFATTGGGTLFPPRALHPDASRDDIFMSVCPTTDDIWFWAQAVRNGTGTAVAGKYLQIKEIPSAQEISLRTDNFHGLNLNDKNLAALAAMYPEIAEIVGKAR
ncbi:MAG: PIG-L family deacetylase [Rickettsiales bacterium]|jgi:LmbE family N-acetylglucosaminyl deacetylase|nr:PIG-L family deacetylase [Rickettsiales bacterium]